MESILDIFVLGADPRVRQWFWFFVSYLLNLSFIFLSLGACPPFLI
jgi:hypothetical protein